MDQSAPDCSLCGAEEEGIHWITVQKEGVGEKMDVDLCDDCLELTRRYNRGEDVDWPTTEGSR